MSATGTPRARSRLLVVAALATVLGLCLVAASPAGAVPTKFWGVVPQFSPTGSELQRLKRGGVDSIRVPISWGDTQPTRDGGYDWSDSDATIADAVASGVEVLPFLSSAPSWAVRSAPVPGTGGEAYAPLTLPVRNAVQRQGWFRFVVGAVRRYGPGGSFWRQNPRLPRRPIRTWQIWNEPNFKFFVARPSPAQYGALVKLSHAALKRADRGARLVLAGLFARPAEALIERGPKQAYFATDFLSRMYRSTPGVGARFQGVALHPYTGTWKRLVPYIRAVRRVLDRHGDGRKGLWITELGWSSGRPEPGNSFAKGFRGQARELSKAFRLLRNRQRAWKLRRVYWFSLNDHAGLCNFCDGTGLFRSGFRPKPAWYVYARLAGGRPR